MSGASTWPSTCPALVIRAWSFARTETDRLLSLRTSTIEDGPYGPQRLLSVFPIRRSGSCPLADATGPLGNCNGCPPSLYCVVTLFLDNGARVRLEPLGFSLSQHVHIRHKFPELSMHFILAGEQGTSRQSDACRRLPTPLPHFLVFSFP